MSEFPHRDNALVTARPFGLTFLGLRLPAPLRELDSSEFTLVTEAQSVPGSIN